MKPYVTNRVRKAGVLNPVAAVARGWLLALTALLFATALPLAAQRWHAATTSQLSKQAVPPLEDMAHMSWVRRDGAPSDSIRGISGCLLYRSRLRPPQAAISVRDQAVVDGRR